MRDEATLRKNARWAPQPKQELALSRTEFEIGFGGARGGGKTDGGIAWLGYDSHEPRLRGVILRKNTVDLQDALIRVREIHPRVKIYGNPPIVKFPDRNGSIERTKDGELLGGATYFTGHLKDKNSLSKWVGQNLQRSLIEELNLLPSEDTYVSFLASLRSTIPGVPAQAFNTFNPDNVGHTWIKRRFGLSGIPTGLIATKDQRTGRARVFIPSRVEDNRALMDSDPEYVRTLEGLPDGLREQWRWGSWDDPIIRGAYYTVELAQMRREGRICELPFTPGASVHTWWDIGADTTAIIFGQFVGEWLYIIDFYMNDSLGFPFYLAKLKELAIERGYVYGIHHFPHDLDRMEWGTGRNRKEVLESTAIDYEVIKRPQSKQGAIDSTRLLFPMLKIDQHRCAQLLDALINYRKEWIEAKQTFTDQPVHDWASHPADALSYVAMSQLDSIRPEHRPSQEAAMARAEAQAPRVRSSEFGGGGGSPGGSSPFNMGG